MKKLFSISKVNLEPTFTAHWYQIALKMQLNARAKQKVDQKLDMPWFDKMQLHENEILFQETLLNVNHRFFINHNFHSLEGKYRNETPYHVSMTLLYNDGHHHHWDHSICANITGNYWAVSILGLKIILAENVNFWQVLKWLFNDFLQNMVSLFQLQTAVHSVQKYSPTNDAWIIIIKWSSM